MSSFGLASGLFFLLPWMRKRQYEWIGRFLDGSKFFRAPSTQKGSRKPDRQCDSEVVTNPSR